MRLAITFVVIYVTTSMPTKKNTSESSESYEDDDDDGESWECGTDDFSKYLSENQIEIDCPHMKKTINSCCIRHDSCYDDQLGRKFCDDTFCRCLDSATQGSEVCNKENSPLFCGMVREFGGDPYLQAGNNTQLAVIDKTQETTNQTIARNSTSGDYDYESGLRVNESFVENSYLNVEGIDLLDSILKTQQS